jgi:hypothetical protein
VLHGFASGGPYDQTTGDLLFVNVETAANRVQYLQHFGIFSLSHGNLLFDLPAFW